jgi:hypothetical protein
MYKNEMYASKRRYSQKKLNYLSSTPSADNVKKGQ